MQKLKIEHQAGSGLVNELAKQLYRSPNEAFREIISNSIDEGSKKVVIKLTARKITFEDYGNGIQDPKKFAIYGQSVKLDKSGELVGEKGIGKLSVLSIATKKKEQVVFLTNNGKVGMNIVMDKEGFTVEVDKVDKYLDHQGTKLVVEDPSYVPTQEELIKFIGKTFGLWIKKGLEIIVNDETVKPFKEIIVEEQKIVKGVTGNIREDQKGTGSLDVYIKHVYVTSVLVDQNYLYSGWVNCNWITPTTARDDVVKDEKFRKFLNSMKEYVKKFPEKEPKSFTNEEKVLLTEMNKLTETFLQENDIKVIGKTGARKTKEVEQMVEVSVGGSSMLVKKREVSEKDDDEENDDAPTKERNNPEETQKLNDKPIRHLNKNKFGVLVVNQQYGEEKPPIFFFPPNVIVLNTNNPLYIFAMRPSSNLGPQYVRVLPYLARAMCDLVASIRGDYDGLSTKDTLEKRDLQTDDITRFFLKIKRAMYDRRPPQEAQPITKHKIAKHIDDMEKKLENQQKELEKIEQDIKTKRQNIVHAEKEIKDQKTKTQEIIITHKKRK